MDTTLNQYKHIFFIGIGGISMSGLSEVLRNQGKVIKGSDQATSAITEHLETLGITVFQGHSPEHITTDLDLVVYTAAVKDDNVEFMEAKRLGIPLMDRATLLGHIMDNYNMSIGVAGTHGKTTTTSMLSCIMLEAELDPTISVGGILKAINGNFKVGQSDYFITEACEYSNSYFKFKPNISIVLNIEEDHMDFFKNLDHIRQSFKRYISNTKTGGLLIMNDQIPHWEALVDDKSYQLVTVGLNDTSDYYYRDLQFDKNGFGSFELFEKGVSQGCFQLMVTGEHNAQNALATIAASRFMGVSYDNIQRGLLKFGGADRRFEIKGEVNGITVIDDYAHHPTEIIKTIEAARHLAHHDLWIVFQPHTYSRTTEFFDDFVKALSLADHVIVTDIYAAREKDPGTIHSKMLVESISNFHKDIVYIDDFDEICQFVLNKAVPKDLLITMGAGTVTKLSSMIFNQ